MAARKKVTKKVSKSGSKTASIRAKGTTRPKGKGAGGKTVRSRSASAARSVKSATTKTKKTKAKSERAAAKATAVETKPQKVATGRSGGGKVAVAKPVTKAVKTAATQKGDKGENKKTESKKAEAEIKKFELKAAPVQVEAKTGVETKARVEPKAEHQKPDQQKSEQQKEAHRGEMKRAEPAPKRNTTAAAPALAGVTTSTMTTEAAKASAPVTIVPASNPASAVKAAKAPSPVKPMDREPAGGEQKTMKSSSPKHGFKLNEFVVYPAHGVGQIVAMEEQEVAGFRLELFVINFVKDKMTLRVPTSKVSGVGMRKLSDAEGVRRSLEILTGRARIKRTMWSRRAQEYEAKINSGDINAIAEVVRDLFRSEAQPEQSYSERQLYEAALDRMMREIAAVQKLSETEALKVIDTQLRKNTKRGVKPETGDVAEAGIEEAA